MMAVQSTETRLPVIAIDGPAGAGKSSVARRLAERLGLVLIDTGALYRAVALMALKEGIEWTNATALGQLAARLNLRFTTGQKDMAPRLLVDGRDRSSEIRSPEISEGASIVSGHRSVRQALLVVQRAMGEGGGVVLEGRDIGTVVFPSADLKIYLTASVDVRAERRHLELLGRGIASDLSQVKLEIETRDHRDSTREEAPLRAAVGARHVDTSGLGLDEVVDTLVELAH